MLEMDKIKREKYEAQFAGKEVEVLMEESIQMNGKTFQVGHTKEYVKVAFETDENLQNQLITLEIGGFSQIIH